MEFLREAFKYVQNQPASTEAQEDWRVAKASYAEFLQKQEERIKSLRLPTDEQYYWMG